MSETTSPFEVASSFEAGELQGGVRLGRLEAQYEELFSEVIEDGVITELEVESGPGVSVSSCDNLLTKV